MHIGYKRVSTRDQTTARQLDGVPLDRIYEDFVSGATKDRPQLKSCLDALRQGDALYIHSVDRLSRSVRDLVEIVDHVIKAGAKIILVKEGLSLSGHKDDMFSLCMVQVMGCFAELERAMSRERQREGIAQTKIHGTRSGKPFGNQPLDMTRATEAKSLSASGMSNRKIAIQMNLSRPSIAKLLA